MSMLGRFKALGWVVTIGTVLGAILFALAGARSIKKSSSAKRKVDKAIELQNTGIASQIAKSKKLLNSAGKDKLVATEAQRKMEQQLEKLGESNEDIDAIADRFNSRRLRKSA